MRLTRTAILVGSNKIWDLPPHDQVQLTGAGVGAKRKGPHDLYLVPLATALAKEGQAQKAVAIYADVETPFRLLIEVIFTCAETPFRAQAGGRARNLGEAGSAQPEGRALDGGGNPLG